MIRVPDGRRGQTAETSPRRRSARKSTIRSRCTSRNAFKALGYRAGSLPESERAARETLAPPIFPELRVVEQRAVVSRIAEFFGVARPTAHAAVKRPKFLGRQAAASPSEKV